MAVRCSRSGRPVIVSRSTGQSGWARRLAPFRFDPLRH